MVGDGRPVSRTEPPRADRSEQAQAFRQRRQFAQPGRGRQAAGADRQRKGQHTGRAVPAMGPSSGRSVSRETA